MSLNQLRPVVNMFLEFSRNRGLKSQIYINKRRPAEIITSKCFGKYILFQ